MISTTDRLIDYIVEILFAVYALTYYFRTPEYESNRGFSNRVAKKSEEAWNYVQKLAGRVFIVIAAVLLVINLVSEQLYGFGSDLHFWINMIAEVASIVLVIPIVNALSRRKYPD